MEKLTLQLFPSQLLTERHRKTAIHNPFPLRGRNRAINSLSYSCAAVSSPVVVSSVPHLYLSIRFSVILMLRTLSSPDRKDEDPSRLIFTCRSSNREDLFFSMIHIRSFLLLVIHNKKCLSFHSEAADVSVLNEKFLMTSNK